MTMMWTSTKNVSNIWKSKIFIEDISMPLQLRSWNKLNFFTFEKFRLTIKYLRYSNATGMRSEISRWSILLPTRCWMKIALWKIDTVVSLGQLNMRISGIIFQRLKKTSSFTCRFRVPGSMSYSSELGLYDEKLELS